MERSGTESPWRVSLSATCGEGFLWYAWKGVKSGAQYFVNQNFVCIFAGFKKRAIAFGAMGCVKIALSNTF